MRYTKTWYYHYGEARRRDNRTCFVCGRTTVVMVCYVAKQGASYTFDYVDSTELVRSTDKVPEEVVSIMTLCAACRRFAFIRGTDFVNDEISRNGGAWLIHDSDDAVVLAQGLEV